MCTSFFNVSAKSFVPLTKSVLDYAVMRLGFSSHVLQEVCYFCCFCITNSFVTFSTVGLIYTKNRPK